MVWGRTMERLPQAKGIPARMGEIQWISARAVQASQKSLLESHQSKNFRRVLV